MCLCSVVQHLLSHFSFLTFSLSTESSESIVARCSWTCSLFTTIPMSLLFFYPYSSQSSPLHLIIGHERYFSNRIFMGLDLILSFFFCQLHTKAILEATLANDSCITPSPHSHLNNKTWREESIHHSTHHFNTLCLHHHSIQKTTYHICYKGLFHLHRHLRLRHQATLNVIHN